EGAALKLLFLFSGVLPCLSGFSAAHIQNNYLAASVFLLGYGLLAGIASMPLDLYSTFKIEAKFGFNKMTFGMWLMDRIKGALLAIILGVPFVCALLWLTLNTGKLWWLWAA